MLRLTASIVCIGIVAGAATADDLGTAGETGPFVPGELIVGFDDLPTLQLTDEVGEVIGIDVTWRALRHAPHALGNPNEPHPLAFYRLATVDETTDVHALAERVAQIPGVSMASVNGAPEPAGAPNDPLYPQQWSHAAINSEAGWAISTGDTDIIIGVIDTGCRITHEDLAAHIWVNDDPVNGIDDDGNGFIDDTNGWDFVNNDRTVEDVFGHGTQASGIVGAPIDNGTGVAGMGNLTIMTSKWWHNSGSDATVAESVTYAADNGARVVNLSLSCGCLMPLTEVAVNYAHSLNVVVVCSSGNGGTSSPHYPAAYPNAMAVGAVDINGNRPSFSSWGNHLDVAAPSPSIYTCGENSDNDYDPSFRGTSAAAPHCAGLAGLVLSVDPSLTNDEVRALINGNAQDIGAPGFDNQFGNGRIDVGSTLAAIAAPCDGDTNGDGVVNVTDLLQVLSDWGACGGCAGDINGDGVVNVGDILVLLANFGPC